MISDSKNGYPKGYYYDSVNINNATLGYNEIFDGEKEVGNLLWFLIVVFFVSCYVNDSLVTYHRGLLLCRNTLVSGPRWLCWMLIWMVMWTWRSAPAHTETQVPWTITYVLIFCIWERVFIGFTCFPSLLSYQEIELDLKCSSERKGFLRYWSLVYVDLL